MQTHETLEEDGSQTLAQDSVSVTFFTTTCPHHMPDTSFSIPINTLPEGLSAVVNSVLELKGAPIPFDFLHENAFITSTLEKYLRRKKLSTESILKLEYTPALQAQEGSKLPHDDWVATVRTPVFGDSSILLTGAYDHCVRLWAQDDCVTIGAAHLEAVKEIALHPTIKLVQGGAPTKNSNSQRMTGGKTKRNDTKADQLLSAADYQMMFVSSGKDGHLAVWEIVNGQIACRGNHLVHLDAVETCDVHRSGKYIASGSFDTTVKIFQWEDLYQEGYQEGKGKKAGFVSMASPAGLAPISPLWNFDDHARAILSVRFSPSQEAILYSCGLDGSIKVWDVEKGELVQTLKVSHPMQSMHVRPNTAGDLLVCGHTDNRVRIFDPRDPTKAPLSFTGHRQWVYGATWFWRREEEESNPKPKQSSSSARQHSNNNLFASCSEDATVRVWDIRGTSSALMTLDRLHTDGVLDVTYVGNQEIASCGKDNKTKTFHIEQ